MVVVFFQNIAEVGHLLAAHRFEHVLADPGLAVLHRLDGQLDVVPLVEPADVHDLAGDGGGEHHHLALLGQAVEDFADVPVEAHVEHLVRLVEHRDLHLRKVDRAAVHVVEHPPRRGDDDLRPPLEGVDLFIDRLAAVDGHHLDVGPEIGELAQLLHDLGGELAGRAEDDRLHRGLFGVDLLHDRDAEGAGLARAGGGLGDDLPALHHDRDRLLLDLGHLGEAHPLHRFQRLFRKIEITVLCHSL